MRIADRELSRETGLARLRRYASKYPDTIRFYDLAGDPDARPGPDGAAEPVNEVTLADLGRLVVINGNLRADDIGKLMDVRTAHEFEAVPPTAQLEQCRPGSELYAAATALYEKYRFKHGSNIGRGRVAGRNLTSRLPQNPYVNLSIHTALVTLVTSRLRGPISSARTCGGTLR